MRNIFRYLQINQVQGHTMHVKNLHRILGPSYVSGIGRHLPHPQRDHRQRDPLDLEAKQKSGRTTVQLGEFRWQTHRTITKTQELLWKTATFHPYFFGAFGHPKPLRRHLNELCTRVAHPLKFADVLKKKVATEGNGATSTMEFTLW